MRQFGKLIGVSQRTYASETSSEGPLEDDLRECVCYHCGFYMIEPVLYESNFYEKECLVNSYPPILPQGYTMEDLCLGVDYAKKKKCRKAKRQINAHQENYDEASSHVNSNHDREGTF